MTKAEIETIVNAFLAPSQPITANGMHKPSMQALIDELYTAQSRGDVLAGVTVGSSLNTGDLVFVIRSGAARLVNKSNFSGGNRWRGDYDASTNLFPNPGDVLPGDEFFVSVTGSLNGEDVPVGTILKARTTNPNQVATNWRII
jgi:hypothetical protein